MKPGPKALCGRDKLLHWHQRELYHQLRVFFFNETKRIDARRTESLVVTYCQHDGSTRVRSHFDVLFFPGFESGGVHSQEISSRIEIQSCLPDRWSVLVCHCFKSQAGCWICDRDLRPWNQSASLIRDGNSEAAHCRLLRESCTRNEYESNGGNPCSAHAQHSPTGGP